MVLQKDYPFFTLTVILLMSKLIIPDNISDILIVSLLKLTNYSD